MRRTAFALALLLAAGWAAPSSAQGWDGGWGRPCFGPCRPWPGGFWARPGGLVALGFAPRPRPFWAGPGAFGPPRFRPAGWGWGWRRWAWRREMRWRRFEVWRRWAEAGRQAALPAADGRRLHRWARRVMPDRAPEPAMVRAEAVRPTTVAAPRSAAEERRAPPRADAAVALMPIGGLRLSLRRAPAPVPSRVLAAASMLRRPARRLLPAVLRLPESPSRPAKPRPGPSLRPGTAPVPPHAALRPAALQSQPIRPTEPAAPPPAAAPADVPVAPLE